MMSPFNGRASPAQEKKDMVEDDPIGWGVGGALVGGLIGGIIGGRIGAMAGAVVGSGAGFLHASSTNRLKSEIKMLEHCIYNLETNIDELTAGYAIMLGRVEETENKIRILENELVKLWNLTEGIPEMRRNLQGLYTRLVEAKKKSVPALNR